MGLLHLMSSRIECVTEINKLARVRYLENCSTAPLSSTGAMGLPFIIRVDKTQTPGHPYNTPRELYNSIINRPTPTPAEYFAY